MLHCVRHPHGRQAPTGGPTLVGRALGLILAFNLIQFLYMMGCSEVLVGWAIPVTLFL